MAPFWGEHMKKVKREGLIRRSTLAVALGMGLFGVAGDNAFAQSNASGVIFGKAEAAPGTTVHLENIDTGLARDITVDANGRYRASSLPIGRYRVSLQRDGQTIESRDNVQVAVGTGAEVSFASAREVRELEGLSVVASALPAIDVSSVDSRTVFTSEQLQKLPVAQNVNAAALLAPGNVAGDSRYGNAISMGGASAAENQYYINGFPVTNPLTGLGFTSLPFNAIDQEQVFTGGYGAEYGRSTGGVVNIITKRGGNTWKAGGQVLWAPDTLSASPRSIYYAKNGLPKTDGTIYQDRHENVATSTQYGAYLSGPLIKDHLFLYVSGQFNRDMGTNRRPVSEATEWNTDVKTSRWLGKVDWNINDSNILEFTAFGEDGKEDDQVYNFDYTTRQKGTYRGNYYRKNMGVANSSPGGRAGIVKYTGYVTDDITINALWGKSKAQHVETLSGLGGVDCPTITDSRPVPANELRKGCSPVGSFLTRQRIPGAEDTTYARRLDVEYRLGSHDLRAGIDNQTLSSYSGVVTVGNEQWVYTDAPADGNIPGFPEVVIPPGATIVQRTVVSNQGTVSVVQEAQFIEDHWQVSDRWMAYIGLRNEQFKNYNTDGQVYVKQRHQLAPRLGVTWDVFGDSSLKVYANAGRYHLAVPANVAIRGAGPQIFTNQYFTYDGVDPANNAPINLTPISEVHFANGADGTSPDPKTLSKKGLSAYYQDEYILGADWQMAPNWVVGAKGTFRKLKSIIDDFCDARPFINYAAANGITLTNPDFVNYETDGSPCLLFNPGEGGDFLVDTTGNGDFQTFHMSAKDLGYPKLKREYLALNVYLEHQFSNNSYAKFDYTWSHSFGNSEGLLLSDIGQVDPSVTQTWDFPEIMRGTNGPLPNDRTHQLRVFGFWQATPEWLFNSVVTAVSGRPKNCMSTAPDDPYGYGSNFFFCNGQPTTRGAAGRLPWTYNINLGAEWRPAWAGHNLAFTADVFNLLNQQREQSRIDASQTGSGAPSINYRRVLSYSDPRYVRFGARYDFSL
jgi:hypothetical protein